MTHKVMVIQQVDEVGSYPSEELVKYFYSLSQKFSTTQFQIECWGLLQGDIKFIYVFVLFM